MSFVTEYKLSLKSVDVEEIIDLLIFRPVSFMFVKILLPTSITPNQISVISMIFGVLAGILISLGKYDFLLAGAIFLFISNMLDCADGQLARLKKNGTKIGRIIDGFIDYITGISIFIGMGSAVSILTGNPLYGWGIAFVGGFSRTIQNMFFDYYRNIYLTYVYNKGSNIDNEIEEFIQEREKLVNIKGKFIEKLLIEIYIKYTLLQKGSTRHVKLDVTPDIYKNKNQLILRLWSWIGSTTHLTAVIIFLILGRPDIYLILTIILGNIIFIFLFVYQRLITLKLTLKNN